MLSYVLTGNVTYIGLSVMTKCVYSKIREIKTHLSKKLHLINVGISHKLVMLIFLEISINYFCNVFQGYDII